MGMLPSGEIVPLSDGEAAELAATGRVRGVAAQLVAIGDKVMVSGRACVVRKVTAKDIILRPIPTDGGSTSPTERSP